MAVPRQLPNAITIVRILFAPVFLWLLLVDGDAHLADQHDDRDPPRQLAEDGQSHEREAGEHLVGDRIEQLAQIGDDVVSARDPPVDAVGRDGEDEQCGRPPSQWSVGTAVQEQQP